MLNKSKEYPYGNDFFFIPRKTHKHEKNKNIRFFLITEIHEKNRMFK